MNLSMPKFDFLYLDFYNIESIAIFQKQVWEGIMGASNWGVLHGKNSNCWSFDWEGRKRQIKSKQNETKTLSSMLFLKYRVKKKSILKRYINSEKTLVLRVAKKSTVINTSRFFQLIRLKIECTMYPLCASECMKSQSLSNTLKICSTTLFYQERLSW